jgi:Fe-S-cluster containining protein
MDCTRCGQCCTTAPINLWKLTPENRAELMDRVQWLSLHRCDMQINKEDGVVISIPISCIHLSYTDDGQAVCGIYKVRPNMCKEFKCKKIGGTSATSQTSSS